jgi:ubiquitin thioesterase OTU1
MCGSARPPASLSRQTVPADNTCLFTAVGYLVDRSLERGGHWRAAVVSAIRADAQALELSEAALGKSPDAYADYMSARSVWGGGIELSVLSILAGVELVAIEVRTGRPYVFGEGKGLARRGYLVFDGLHYDALHRAEHSGTITTLFSASDGEASASASAFVAELKRAHAFTDLAGFTLRCGACAAGIRGEAEAVEHARENPGHTNFAEYEEAT